MAIKLTHDQQVAIQELDYLFNTNGKGELVLKPEISASELHRKVDNVTESFKERG